MVDSWNPEQYQKFEKERNQPFYDLMHMVSIQPHMKVVDLGCGTGKLTQLLHTTLQAQSTLGLDASSAMLKEAFALEQPHLHFQLLEIEKFRPTEKYDLIFSNSALQWVPNHLEILAQLFKRLSKNGQVAIQLPANFDFPTHTLAQEIANETRFKAFLHSSQHPQAHTVEEYSSLLYRAGFQEQHVRLQVYPLVLQSTDSVIEWVKGSILTYYRSQLPSELYHNFLEVYTKRLKTFFGEQSPFFLPFKRILFWAQK